MRPTARSTCPDKLSDAAKHTAVTVCRPATDFRRLKLTAARLSARLAWPATESVGMNPKNPKQARPKLGRARRIREPLYRVVVHALKSEILLGKYSVGAPLPSEQALLRRFKVSRHTVREALRHLRDLGLVESHQGRGTLVRNAAGPRTYVHQLDSIGDLHDYGVESRYSDAARAIKLTKQLAAQLGATIGENWLLIEGLRYINPADSPICAVDIYVPARFAGITRLLGRRSAPIFSLIESVYGESIEEVDQHLRAMIAPAQIARRLGIRSEETVLEIQREYRLRGGLRAEVSFNYYKASAFKVSMHLRRVRPA
jgi:GntR family transcriptional regulator